MKADPGYFGPDSMMWKVNKEITVLFGGARALLMHAAHPLIAAGARQTSFYQRDPWKRLIRTLSLQNSVTFGSKNEADESAHRINKLHEVIKGNDEVTGDVYDALDHEQLLWVHACLQISSIYFYEKTVKKLSVEENIKAALQTKFKNIEIEDKYKSIMKEFDLFSIEKQISENLSGGQRRKLEIARAFALEPKFILLDEPFAGIDPLTINEIKNIISKLRAKNVGVVISDHNAQATMDICDNISVINNGEIIASGNSSSIKENNTVQQIYLGENLT